MPKTRPAGLLARSARYGGFELSRANHAEHAVRTMCWALGVSRSGCYAWRGGERSYHAQRGKELRATILAIYEASSGLQTRRTDPRIARMPRCVRAVAGCPMRRRRYFSLSLIVTPGIPASRRMA